jgi:hypothetical protein
MLCNMVARGHADTYQKHNVGNVGNVGHVFQVAGTTRPNARLTC